MSEPTTDRVRRSVAGYTRQSVRELAPWRKWLLVLSILATTLGGIGAVIGMRVPAPTTPVVSGARADAASFTGEDVRVAGENARHWFYDRVAPHLWRGGLSFFVAFVVGFLFRRFLLAMAATFGALLAILAVLDWMNLIDIVPKVRQDVESASDWLRSSAGGFVELVKSRLPASFLTTAGFVVGFLRR